MNPSRALMDVINQQYQRAVSARSARQEQLHRAAVSRRRKAKNGGRR